MQKITIQIKKPAKKERASVNYRYFYSFQERAAER